MTLTLLRSPFAQILPLRNEISRRESGGQVIGPLLYALGVGGGALATSFLAILIFILKKY